MKISNLPPKGTSDWFPDELQKRMYIFNTWRAVCQKFGYQEYLTPVFEHSEVYKAKSGEDVGGQELTVFKDRGGREMAIRPEMTPSVTRMVTRMYNNYPKPVRLFSIANFVRNEKPQKGRNREFWQLNVDMFGSNSMEADVEILAMVMSLLSAFGAGQDDYSVLVNHRDLIKYIVTDIFNVEETQVPNAIRILDKFWKISNDEFVQRLEKECGAKIEDKNLTIAFLKKEDSALRQVVEQIMQSGNTGMSYMTKLSDLMDEYDFESVGNFDPTLVRGFDYYDGIVFEVVDKNLLAQRSGDDRISAVERSIFGGGRYNGLASIFGSESFPAVGFAPGDETMKLFLEAKELMPDFNDRKAIYVPMLKDVKSSYLYKISSSLRGQGFAVLQGVEVQKLGKAIEFADKSKYASVVIVGEEEQSAGTYRIKDLETGEEKVHTAAFG